MASFVVYERQKANSETGGDWRHRTFRKLGKAIDALAAAEDVAYIVVDGVQRYRNRRTPGAEEYLPSVWVLPDRSSTSVSAGRETPVDPGGDRSAAEPEHEAA